MISGKSVDKPFLPNSINLRIIKFIYAKKFGVCLKNKTKIMLKEDTLLDPEEEDDDMGMTPTDEDADDTDEEDEPEEDEEESEEEDEEV
ncbi:MAG: hypothetical protein WCP18_01085 [bacterium]